MEEEGYSSDEENPDVVVPPIQKGVWKEDFITVNIEKSPSLVKMFNGNTEQPKRLMNNLFTELFTLLGDGKGRAIIVPQVKARAGVMEQARRLKWIYSLLDHIAGGECGKENAAEWFSYYFGKVYDGAFTVASESLGIPLVQRLDATNAAAMWSDANVNITQQRLLKKHLRLHFGKRLFIPEQMFTNDLERYHIPTFYGDYKFYKNDDLTQKPKKCPYWYRDASVVVINELTRILDYTDMLSNFNSLSSISGCTLVAGANQGQGAWHSWIKIAAMSGIEVRERMSTDENFDPKGSYINSQIAHITCK